MALSKVKGVSKFYDFLDTKPDCGILSPPITGQESVDLLRYYLLGEDWYSVNPVSTEQINTEIVYEILRKYSPKFNREFRKLEKIKRKEDKLAYKRRKEEAKLARLKERYGNKN